MNAEAAETLAARALGWIVAQEGLFEVFQGATGANLEDIRTQAQAPEFLAAVLDFLLMDDAWVTGFCEAETLPYETLMRARAALPGGDLPHWT